MTSNEVILLPGPYAEPGEVHQAAGLIEMMKMWRVTGGDGENVTIRPVEKSR